MGTHRDTGVRCLVAHSDGTMCTQCANCYMWLRPHEINEVCPNDDEAMRQHEDELKDKDNGNQGG